MIHNCCICFQPMTHPYIEDDYLGNSALPVKAGRCCDLCDCTVVLTRRMRDAGVPENAVMEMMQTEIIARVTKWDMSVVDVGLTGHEWFEGHMELIKEATDDAVPFCSEDGDV